MKLGVATSMKGFRAVRARAARLRPRLTYANVVSSLCLFLVLGGGTAYATHLVVDGSDIVDGSVDEYDIRNGGISTVDIRDGQVTGWDLGDNSVQGVHVLHGTLSGDDIRDGSVHGTDIADASLTGTDVAAASLTGDDIRDGSIRENDVAGGVMRGWELRTNNVTVPPLSSATTTAFCPPGKRVLGGGFSQPAYDLQVTDSAPSSQLDGWQVFAQNEGALSRTLTVYALCASVA